MKKEIIIIAILLFIFLAVNLFATSILINNQEQKASISIKNVQEIKAQSSQLAVKNTEPKERVCEKSDKSCAVMTVSVNLIGFSEK